VTVIKRHSGDDLVPNTPSVTCVLTVEEVSGPSIVGEPEQSQSASLGKIPIRDMGLVACEVVSTVPCTLDARTRESHLSGDLLHPPLPMPMNDVESV
jgi:hypothetical protein